MNYLNDRNYIAIADWMIKDYDLTTRELLTYAIIYGFSQDGESVFHSSLEYLSQWLNISHRNNVLRILQSLIEKGLMSLGIPFASFIAECLSGLFSGIMSAVVLMLFDNVKKHFKAKSDEIRYAACIT